MHIYIWKRQFCSSSKYLHFEETADKTFSYLDVLLPISARIYDQILKYVVPSESQGYWKDVAMQGMSLQGYHPPYLLQERIPILFPTTLS